MTTITLIAIFAVVAAMFGFLAAAAAVVISIRATKRADELLDNVADLAVKVVQIEHLRTAPHVAPAEVSETAEDREAKRRALEAQAKYLEGINNILKYDGNPRKEGAE